MSNHTSHLHHRLLAAGLIAAVATISVAGTAQASTPEASTVSTGHREAVTTAVVSPRALPATLEVSGPRRSTQVTITL